MVADGLKKALGPERHQKLAKMMGMGMWKKRMAEKDLKDQKDQTKNLWLRDHQNEEWE
jgi:hypothetical protein